MVHIFLTHPTAHPQTDTRFGERLWKHHPSYLLSADLQQQLSGWHVWLLVAAKSLDHLTSKFFELFAFFFVQEGYFGLSSFHLADTCMFPSRCK